MIQTKLRAPDELMRNLQEEADRRGMSFNSLANSILHRHVVESRRVLVQIDRRAV
jgi:predicted HicB family RNase H-like nuclease